MLMASLPLQVRNSNKRLHELQLWLNHPSKWILETLRYTVSVYRYRKITCTCSLIIRVDGFLPWTIDCKTARIFAYSSMRKQSNKRSGTRLKTESKTGERH